MNLIPQDYLDKIGQAHPELSLERLDFNQDGMVNDVVIVDDDLVCRFPRNDWGRNELQHEARVLELVRRHVTVPIPRFEVLEDGFASYRFLPGVPLTRGLLLRLPEATGSAVLAEVVHFVRTLHDIPRSELEAAGIGPSVTNRDRNWWLKFLDDFRERVFPQLMRYQRAFVDEHFEPVVSGELSLAYEPRLVSGDLAPYHLLFDPAASRLAGVIDFGTAGLGDPAVDLATLLNVYGESLLDPALEVYPELRSCLDRARFWAGTLELQWALLGLEPGTRDLAFAHLGGARDLLPVGFAAVARRS